ncbi:AI-2E family transporter [Lachnospiraceae bacterium ZAX-1]
MREELKKPLLEIVKIVGIAFLVYVAIRWLLPLVFPFFIALLSAKLLHPMVEKLNKKLKIKKGFLSVAVSGFFLVLAGAIFWIMLKNLFIQVKNLLENMGGFQEKALGWWNSCCDMASDFTGIKAEVIDRAIQEKLPAIWEDMREKLLPTLMDGSLVYAKNTFLLVGIFVITSIATVMMLNDYTKMKTNMQASVLGNSCLRICRKAYRAGNTYIKSQFIIMITVSFVCVAGLFFAGHKYVLIRGCGIGLCDALPFLGTGTIFIPWALLELAQGKYMLAAIYAAIYAICTLLREVLEPKLLGNRLGIHPLVIIITIYAGIYIYGIWGFALGPLTYILIKEIWLELQVNSNISQEYDRYL